MSEEDGWPDRRRDRAMNESIGEGAEVWKKRHGPEARGTSVALEASGNNRAGLTLSTRGLFPGVIDGQLTG